MSLRLVEPTDEERWAQAESILARRPTEAARARMRRRRTMLWLFIVSVLVLVGGVGVLLGLMVGGRSGDADPAGWQQVVGFGVVCAGLLVEIAGIVVLVRTRRWGQAWRGPMAALSRRQQRYLLAQIRGRRPVDPERLPLARDLAERLADQRWVAVLLVALLLLNLGTTIANPMPLQLGFTAGVVVLFTVAGVLGVRQVRQARRFLADNPRETLTR